MIGYAEENNVAFLRTAAGIFMVQLHSLHFKKLLENNNSVTCYPLESVYDAGNNMSSNRCCNETMLIFGNWLMEFRSHTLMLS
jgi:C4-dicarboxylate transporter